MTDELTVRDLEQACTYHFLALLFQAPSAELHDELSGLAGVLREELRPEARELVGEAGADVELDYHAVLGSSGQCRDCESDYEVNALGGKGPLLADVAAFYRAFQFAAEALHLAPDHVAVELDFLAYLAMKTAYARHAGLAEELEICEAAAALFTADHVGRWTPHFLSRLEALAGGRFHGKAARFTVRALSTCA